MRSHLLSRYGVINVLSFLVEFISHSFFYFCETYVSQIANPELFSNVKIQILALWLVTCVTFDI